MYYILLRHFAQIALTITFVISNSSIYAHSFWVLEEDEQGQTRRVITNYHAENPREMQQLRNLVRYFDAFQIPGTIQPPREWLKFRYGPHEVLRTALADDTTPAVLLNAYIQSYRKGLKEFLDAVETEEEKVEGANGSGSADVAVTTTVSDQAAPSIVEEVREESVGQTAPTTAEATSQTTSTEPDEDDFVQRISGVVNKYMTRLQERLSRETERLGKQAAALAQRLEERLPRETERLGEQAEALAQRVGERAPIEFKRLGDQLGRLFRENKNKGSCLVKRIKTT